MTLKRVAIIIAVLTALSAFRLCKEHPVLVGQINTVYSQDFSYDQFQKIEKGMSKEHVQHMLGSPFAVTRPGYECFHYSKGSARPLPPFAWVSTRVCFDLAQKVVGTYQNVFGM